MMKPEIADEMTVIWIGGGAYPNGGFEFNLLQDIAAASQYYFRLRYAPLADTG